MKVDTLCYIDHQWQAQKVNIADKTKTSIVFVFGDVDAIKDAACFQLLKSKYPNAYVVGSSSAGNVQGTKIMEEPAVATAIQLESGKTVISKVDFVEGDSLEKLSQSLVEKLPREQLKHVFVLSDGLNINGSELVRGINKVGLKCTVTGGLAGDGPRFEETWVMADEPAKQFRIVAVGFYGEALSVSTGCYGGWCSFGIERVVTRSQSNVLYELDGEPALDLYKKYLGDYAKDLPSSGLRFPLGIRENEGDEEVIRTLLAVDEGEKSITFAGDIPEKFTARLMRPNMSGLIDAAAFAAGDIGQTNHHTALGLVVSCVGRRVVLKDFVEEELEAMNEVLGDNVQLTGFYSYGEIAPFKNNDTICQLHNQTMVLTVIYEDLDASAD
ncbi:MAG: FIST C-terminal domain-containing protein [Ghiorsea sp.]